MAAGGIPIAAGENLPSLWEFKNYIAAGAVSYPEPDVTNCGRRVSVPQATFAE
jgi:L-alanine-DL-glutamate epimerase-like enolase superfamily enzyme